MTLLLRYLLGLIGLGGQPAAGGGGEDPEEPEIGKRVGGGLVLSQGATRQRIIPFVNTSGEKIPPRSAVKLKHSRAGARNYHKGYKPDKDDDPFVVFNGPTEVEPDEDGYATADYPLWAKYNPEDGDPVNGESLGTRAGFWELHRGYEGFLVWGGADGEKVYVQPDLTCRDIKNIYPYYYKKRITGRRFAPPEDGCCPGITLPEVMIANIVGTAVHDGAFAMYYNDSASWPSWLPDFTNPLAGCTTSGDITIRTRTNALIGLPYRCWWSNLIEERVCNYNITCNAGLCTINYNLSVTYYSVLVFTGCRWFWLQLEHTVGTNTYTGHESCARTETYDTLMVNGVASLGHYPGPVYVNHCDILVCSPFYWKGYISPPITVSTFYCGPFGVTQASNITAGPTPSTDDAFLAIRKICENFYGEDSLFCGQPIPDFDFDNYLERAGYCIEEQECEEYYDPETDETYEICTPTGNWLSGGPYVEITEGV